MYQNSASKWSASVDARSGISGNMLSVVMRSPR